MDLNVYYKEVARTLRRAAQEVQRFAGEKRSDIPRNEHELREQQKDIKRQESNVKEYAIRAEDGATRASMAKRALDLHNEVKGKDQQLADVKDALSHEAKDLENLAHQLMQEAENYERRTYM